MTNEVSFPTNFGITNPLEWLLKVCDFPKIAKYDRSTGDTFI
jgi:hypothetical protein